MSVNPGSSSSSSSISGSMAVYFDPANPSVNATFSAASLSVYYGGGTFAVRFDPSAPAVNASFSAASLEVVSSTGSRKAMDDAHAAQRVLIVGSQPSASLVVSGTVTANAGTGSMTVQFDPGHTLGKVDAGSGTFNVQLDPGHTLGNVLVTNSPTISGITNSIAAHILSTGGTIQVKTDPSSVIQISNAPTITGITNSIAAHILSTGGTLQVKLDPASKIAGSDSSLAVYLDPGHLLGSVTANAGTGSFTVQFDPGHELGSIKGINNSISTYLSGTAGTLGVRVGQIDGSVAVYFSPANPTVNATFSATSLEVVPTTGSRKTMDDAHAAQRVLVVGSQPSASLLVSGITNSIAVNIQAPDGTSITSFGGGTQYTEGDTDTTITGNAILAEGGSNDLQVPLLESSSSKNLRVGIFAGSGQADVAATGSDGFSSATNVLSTSSKNFGFNGSTWDRIRVGPGVASMAQRVVQATDSVGSVVVNSGTLTGITNSVAVHIGSTGGTLGVRVGQIDGSVAVYFSPANPAVAATFSGTVSAVPETGSGDPIYDEATNSLKVKQVSGGTFAVYFDPASPAVNASFSAASLEVVSSTGSRKAMDDAHAAQRVLIVGSQTNASLTINGSITGITNSIAAHIVGTAGTLQVKTDPSSVLSGITSSVAVYFDRGNPTVTSNAGTGTFTVKTDPSSVIQVSNAPSITGITNSINVYLGGTGGTLGVRVGQVDGTVAVYFSQSRPTVLADAQHTAGIFTASGTASSAGNNTVISPSASYNFKVFAYSISTTGIVSTAPRFTTGASAGATEKYRPIITAAATTSVPVGANLSVTPPGFLFETGTNSTLSLYLDSGTLFHYSVSYIKESA